MSTVTLTDRFRRWSYLQDVELWLDPMAGRRRREVLRELRTNLTDAAADVGMAQAIDDLGKPRDLARAYVQAEPRRRPSWSLGLLGAGAVLLVAMVTGFTYLLGMSDALLGVGGGTADGSFLGLRVLTTATETELSWHLSGWSWPITVGALVALLLCARAWRLVRR